MQMWIKYGAVAAVLVLVLQIPVPDGLKPEAWTTFAAYLALVGGIILRPQLEPVATLVLIAATGFVLPLGTLLSGFSNETVWLVFTAFLINQAFAETGLGKRVAYILIGRIGHSSLGLAYGSAIADLVLSPATPSNTARTGGLVYPIFRNVCEALGSSPGSTSRILGAYMTVLMYHISLTTASMFITAGAPNILVVNFAKSIVNVEITWMMWMWAALVPGLLGLLLIPLIIRLVCPPELKVIPNARELSEKGLTECGPLSLKEKLLILFFFLAIFGWATGHITKLSTAHVALLFLAACLVTNLLNWKAVSSNNSAWSTLIWYAGIIGIANALAKTGFFTWVAEVMKANMNLSGYSSFTVIACLTVAAFALRYFFVSGGAFVVSVIPILLILGHAAGAATMPMCFAIALASQTSAITTHYGGACGPVLFGTGYVDQRTWWLCGAAGSLMHIIIYLTVGLAYWKILGY